jgi:protein-tyrosine phosphatase
MEIEPSGFPDRETCWAKMDDNYADGGTILQAQKAATFTINQIHKGNDCYVFCAEGLNRSSFVIVLVLRRFGFKSAQAIELLRQNRHPTVLKNPEFESYLLSLDGKGTLRFDHFRFD